jgi:hypothetical protein
MSDVLFAMVIVLCFVRSPVGWLSLLMDGDTGFHIRVGDLIRGSGAVPVQHPFSFSVTGQPWYAFEWLSEVAFSALHTAWGLKGVTLAAGLLIAAVFAVIFRYTVWRGASPLIAVVLVLMGLNINRIHFHARPHLLTWLFLVAAIWILEHHRQTRSQIVWCLVPLTALWANLHGGFVIFFVLLALLVAGLAVEGWLVPDDRRDRWMLAKRFTFVGVACAAAACINPYGYRLMHHVTEVLSARWLTNTIVEFAAPSFRTEPTLLFMLMLFVALGLAGRLMHRRRISDLLWVLFLAYSSLISARHITVFVLVVTPIIAVELSILWQRAVDGSTRTSVVRVLDDISGTFASQTARTSIWPAAFALGLALAPNIAWPADFPSDLFPTEVVARHREALATARVFTTDQWSDYLIYTNYPKQRDYVDGQHQYYGEKHVVDYVKTLQGQGAWAEVLDQFRFDFALCPRDAMITTLLRGKSNWRAIDEDARGVLFARTN